MLELILPLLAAHGRAEHPVRVLLLVRGRPRASDDWKGLLRRAAAKNSIRCSTTLIRSRWTSFLSINANATAWFDLAARALAERSRVRRRCPP
jgi:hypothetical protein